MQLTSIFNNRTIILEEFVQSILAAQLYSA